MSERRSAQCAADLTPQGYAEWRGSTLGAITERLEERLIARLLGEVSGRRIVDLGCGDGKLARALAVRGARVVGLDSSAGMIATAAAAPGEARFVVADARALPLAAAAFDLAVSVTMLCFVVDAAPVFAEVARVLRPGGRAVIGVLGRWSLWAAERRLRAWRGDRLWRETRFRGAGELRALARGAGLDAGPVFGSVYYPRWTAAARRIAPYDETLGRATTIGAAFLAFAATKPAIPPASSRASRTAPGP